MKLKLENLKVKGKEDSSIPSNKLQSSFSNIGHNHFRINYDFDDFEC